MDGIHWLLGVERELLLFAGCFFLIGNLDEIAVDAVWIWLRLRGRARALPIDRADYGARALAGPAAVLIPAWHEAAVIGTTIAHIRAAWPQAAMRLYIGCYPNDPATIAAARAAAADDLRIRIVIHTRPGPTTKADCLNRIYTTVLEDAQSGARSARMLVMHDAEDMVDPAALALLDEAIGTADFVQLPVLPVAQPRSRWIAGHYLEEFAEAHGKAMVVRDALRSPLPAAGVGCAFAAAPIARLALRRGGAPFAADSLTEDYELGLGIGTGGGESRFLRARGEDGQLVATRACFPHTLDAAVRQKTRWIHGIALDGWDRLGWSRRWTDGWMRLRDRRGPFVALVLTVAYAALALTVALIFARLANGPRPGPLPPGLAALLSANMAFFLWRAGVRCGFTAAEHGWREGGRAALRIPVANIIAIMAGRRALFAYVASLGGRAPQWDKTDHDTHAAAFLAEGSR